MFELPPAVARLIVDAMDRGMFPSVDDLAAEALTQYLTRGATPKPSEATTGSYLRLPSHVGVIGQETVDTALDAPWIWGMLNRVFPLKLVVRVCANLTGERAVSLHSLHRVASLSAAEIGTLLTADDVKARRKRNESRAVALPTGVELDKAKIRFAQQFVGRKNPTRGYGGGAFDFGLLGIDQATSLVAPTALGWQFAQFESPLLDNLDTSTGNLTDAEKDFFLLKIIPHISAEKDAAMTILRTLEPRALNPDDLAKSIVPRTSPGTSVVVENTARTGAIGRLVDLGAIRRIAMGRSAIFEITPRGKRAIRQLSSKKN